MVGLEAIGTDPKAARNFAVRTAVLPSGQRVTASVVHAIFAAILIDAVFALIYMQFNV